MAEQSESTDPKTDQNRFFSREELFSRYQTGPDGLSDAQAQEGLIQFGPNDLPEHRVSRLRKILGYFWGPIPWMIEIAVILSYITGRYDDFLIILLLLWVNAVVGFWQENKAGNAIELLKQKLALTAHVKRNGRWSEIAGRDLVPGDIVRVRIGEIIPADLILYDGEYLEADESSLTGESLPVEKHPFDSAYDGSIVKQGEMDGVVIATGDNTVFGKTTRLVEEAVTKSHFQRAVVKIGDYLILLALVMVIIVFINSMYRQEDLLQTLAFALVLTVAAIPAALPAVLSVTMAVGAVALSKKEVIVSSLVAIEEMAGMNILCSDKTGTITENTLSVAGIVPFSGYTGEDVITISLLASEKETQDPIDSAIAQKSAGYPGAEKRALEAEITRFIPFDPVRKMTEATIGNDSFAYQVAKGAPQAILALLKNPDPFSADISREVNSFALHGYRALAVARTTADGIWEVAGLIGLYDPPRTDSAATISTAEEMGIDVKMVTGDHEAIAKQIAGEVGIGKKNALPIDFSGISDLQAEKVVNETDIFSEVFPEHKFRIVQLLQKAGHIVGMTGDGVNDAPALKKADVGIAVAGASDAAKSAADIVLTRPGLSVIIDAVEESRKIFQRMNNYSIYRIAETIRVLFFITFSIVLFGFYPVTALMIVLLAILNDFPIMTIAYDRVLYSNRPERWNLRTILGIASILGIFGVMESFGLLYLGISVFNLSTEVLQSFIYLKLSVAGHLCVFMARTKGPFWSVKPALPLVAAVVVTQLIATLLTVYGILLPAMGWGLALFVWGYSFFFLLIIDTIKVRAYRLFDHTNIRFFR